MEIKDIKQQLTILTVAGHYGHRPNRNKLITCPFHEDDKPSLQLYPKTNTWHCFGCGKGTDQLDFIQQKENCSTHEAIGKAKELLGSSTAKAQSSNAETPNKAMTEKERTETLAQAFGHFARSTKAEAKAYLEKRALDIEKTTVGYDGHNFHKGADEETKQRYLSTGLIYPDKLGRENSYHSFFDGCIVLPTFNERNEIVNLYGRCIDESKANKHRYLPGKHQGLYPGYPKAETETLILTESIIDCATLLQHKDTLNFSLLAFHFLACYGTNNFTAEMQEAIKNLKQLKEIIFFFDGDKAGRTAIEAHAKTVKAIKPGIKITYVATPEGEDINSLSQGHESSIFTALLKERKLFLSQEIQEKEMTNDIMTNNSEIVNRKSQIVNILNTDNIDQLIYENEHLVATVWGGIEFNNIKKLRATLHLQSKSNEYLEYRDTVDLYSHGPTQRLIREAAEKLETGTSAMGKTITALTKALEQYRQKERDRQRKKEQEEKNRNKETFTAQEMQAGEKLLKDKGLMQKTEAHIHNIGLTGEEENGLLLFFILLTRMFKDPLHALVQGKSGSGKTYLLRKITNLLPKAHMMSVTALTENTLYHSLKGFWKHMVLLIEDLDGAFNALFPLREFMSNQRIIKLSTEKNLRTGEFEQKILEVEGPVCVAGATTKDSIYEDNANRSFLIQVNETAEHQEKVLDYQRKEIAGLLDKTKEEAAKTLLKAAQLHLEPMEVVIPFGEELRIPDYVFKKYRTNAHYLTLVKAVAFWHQRQREIKQAPDGTRYVEANLQDVAWANKLSREVLLRKSDELNGALRGFFESLKSHVQTTGLNTFFGGQIRTKFRMHPQQLRRYLEELRQRGYIKHTGGSRKTGYEYEVMVWDDYEVLQNGMKVLDDVLASLQEKYKG